MPHDHPGAGLRREVSGSRPDAGARPHPHGHNRGAAEHLHSHMDPADEAEELGILAEQFVDGFAGARDKAAYLRLMGVPLEIGGVGPSGGAALKLVDVELTTRWQVGTASPSFGSAELSYLPFPGPMIQERTDMAFVYVSLREKRLVDLREFLRSRDGRHAAPAATADPTPPAGTGRTGARP